MEQKRSEVLGIPLILIGHAVILTILLSIVMFILLFRMVTPFLVSFDERLQRLEEKPVAVIEPTATPSAMVSPEPTAKKLPTRTVTIPVVSPSN